MEPRLEKIEVLESKIKTLIERAWADNGLNIKRVRYWYSQFKENSETQIDEQVQFLFLLSKFMYFGRREIHYMLRSLFRDLFMYREIRQIRLKNNHTLNEKFLNEEFNKILKKTRFLGIGNPSESGSFLLYKFRHVNELSKELFINAHEVFSVHIETDENGRERQVIKIKDPEIENYIFIDDLTCSGSQAWGYSDVIEIIKKSNPSAKIYYFVLIATKRAIEELNDKDLFDRIDSVFKLDETFKCFSENSRYYKNEESIFNKSFTKICCEKYDGNLESSQYKLGFDDSQLLLAFEHNTPDNVPPVFWSEGKKSSAWIPIFKRYHKKI